MFIVVSKWEILPGHEEEWKGMAASSRERLLAIAGVEFQHRFRNEQGQMVVSMGYTDKATYDKLVNDPNGAVARFMADFKIESVARWVSSDRGESID